LNIANPVAAKNISNLTAFDDGATSSYNGLLLTTQWKATRDLNVNANYTWSHCIGNAANGAGTPNPGTNYVHADNRALDRGNCLSDRRQLFNLTVVARTPKFSNKATRILASGWSLSAIYRYATGTPLTILSGLDQALDGFGSQRPNQLLQNTAAANPGSACANRSPCVNWLNPAAFAQPTAGTLGNMGVLNVTGPKFFQFDTAIVREFRIRESERLEFRAEAFNVLNATRFNNPGVTLSTATSFGIITSSSTTGSTDPRIMQLAMKFVF
jgi:hypothetical protein